MVEAAEVSEEMTLLAGTTATTYSNLVMEQEPEMSGIWAEVEVVTVSGLEDWGMGREAREDLLRMELCLQRLLRHFLGSAFLFCLRVAAIGLRLQCWN